MNFLKALSNVFHFNRTNWRAVALCFFAAAVFWFFHALNKPYSTTVRFPVRFEYDQERYIATRPLPEFVSAHVSGSGWDLFRKRFSFKESPLVVPLERPSESMRLAGTSLIPQLSTQWEDIKVNFVVTDSLYLFIDQRESYEFDVYPDLSSLTFREGYGRVSPVTLSSKKIRLTGPKRALHQLPDSIGLAPRGEKIFQSFQENVPLLVSNVISEPDRISVSFEVDKVVRMELPVSPLMIARPGQKVTIDSAPITITVQKPATAGDLIPLTSALQLDCRKLTEGKHRLMPVVTGLPGSFVVVSVDSVVLTVAPQP
jgi:hypothetical protein